MSQVNQEFVCNGAVCRCDKGTLPNKLVATSQQRVSLQAKLMATTLDKTFLPFGTCAVKNNTPCTPMLLQWQDAFELVTVNSFGSHPLLESSTIPCTFGGKVSIVSTLQLAVLPPPGPRQAEGVRTASMSLCPLLINDQ